MKVDICLVPLLLLLHSVASQIFYVIFIINYYILLLAAHLDFNILYMQSKNLALLTEHMRMDLGFFVGLIMSQSGPISPLPQTPWIAFLTSPPDALSLHSHLQSPHLCLLSGPYSLVSHWFHKPAQILCPPVTLSQLVRFLCVWATRSDTGHPLRPWPYTTRQPSCTCLWLVIKHGADAVCIWVLPVLPQTHYTLVLFYFI